jgi:MOSC domain-containing protein YiiM
MAGIVEHIHIAEVAGGPLIRLDSVEAVAGVGLLGDRYARREGFWKDKDDSEESRDLTLIEAEEIERLARDSGIHLAPGASRRNVTTRGIRLNELVGKEFRIGGVLARGTELCEPCTHLVALTGQSVIKPLTHRAGLRADLLTSGRIGVGDRITVEKEAVNQPSH